MVGDLASMPQIVDVSKFREWRAARDLDVRGKLYFSGKASSHVSFHLRAPGFFRPKGGSTLILEASSNLGTFFGCRILNSVLPFPISRAHISNMRSPC